MSILILSLIFFVDNYPYPIIENGVVLRDMIYLSKHTYPKKQALIL